MAEETYGDEGLILPVPGSRQRFNLSRHWVQNLKKLSDRVKTAFDRTNLLFTRKYLSNNSAGESISSLGSPRSGWKIVGWACDSRGYMQSLKITFERTGAAIKVPGSGNIGNQKVVLLQERFRPYSDSALSSVASGRSANGRVASDGEVWLVSVGGTSDISKGYRFSLAGMVLTKTSGIS